MTIELKEVQDDLCNAAGAALRHPGPSCGGVFFQPRHTGAAVGGERDLLKGGFQHGETPRDEIFV